MNNDHYHTLSLAQVEAKLAALRAEYKTATNARRLVILRQAKGYQNALTLMKKQQDAVALKDYPKQPFNSG